MNWLSRALQWAPDAPSVAPASKQTWALDGARPGQSDRDNFITNRVTVAEYDDHRLSGVSASIGLSATWACVMLIAGTIGTLPLMIYRPVRGGGREVARDHHLFDLLHDSPNADQTAIDWIEFMAASVELHGNGFSLKERGTGGRVVALTPLRPDMVHRRRANDGEIIYRFTEGGRPIEARQDDMLHIRGSGGGPLGGASPLTLCRGAFSAALSAERSAAALFRNGVRPSGVLSQESRFLNADQRSEAETLLADKFAGAMNEGRPMLLDGGLKWEQLTINPDDAQLLESRKFGGEEVCRIFGVPPAMVGYGDKASNWGTGKEVDVLGFQKFTLRRRMKRFEAALAKQMLTAAERAEGYAIEFNLEGLLRGDSEGRARFYKEMTNMDAMVVNEVRALENLPPVPWGNEPRPKQGQAPASVPTGEEQP